MKYIKIERAHFNHKCRHRQHPKDKVSSWGSQEITNYLKFEKGHFSFGTTRTFLNYGFLFLKVNTCRLLVSPYSFSLLHNSRQGGQEEAHLKLRTGTNKATVGKNTRA